MSSPLAVAAGGAVEAVARYLVVTQAGLWLGGGGRLFRMVLA